MTALIPRADIEAILERHSEPPFVDLSGGGLSPVWVRSLADSYRPGAVAIADDLDALADRYEQEAAA